MIKKLFIVSLLISFSLIASASTTNITNYVASRQWVMSLLATTGIDTNNITNSIFTQAGISNRVIASCNWYTSTNYDSFNAVISSNAPGLYRVTMTNNLSIDLVNRTNGVPHITATASTNFGCNIGQFMVTSNIVDFYVRSNITLVNPDSIQFILTR